MDYLRRWAYELHGRSGYTGMGEVAPLTYATIAHWARLTRRSPEPWEIDFLLEADAIMISEPAAIRAKRQAQQQPKSKLPRVQDDE